MNGRLGTSAAIAVLALPVAGHGEHLVLPQDPAPRRTAAELRETFDDLFAMRFDGERCMVILSDGRQVEVVGIAPLDDPILSTAIGRVAIDDWLVVRRDLASLFALIDAEPEPAAPPNVPEAAGAEFTHHRLDFHPLVGPALRLGDSAARTADGTWVIDVDAALPARLQAARRDLDVAAERIAGAALGLQEAPRTTFVAVASLAAADELPEDAVDDLPPHAVRRLIRHGWLRDVFGTRPAGAERVPASRAAAALESAVRAACTLHVAETWSRGEDRILRYVDAFGRTSWVRSGPDGHELASRPPIAGFGELDWDFPDDGWVVLDLDPEQDPVAVIRVAAVRGARFFENGLVIASWTRAGGLSVDPDVWRDDVPIDDLVDELGATADYLPAHIVLTDAHGDVAGLVTAHGLLAPPRSGSPQDSGRFLDDASRLLPGPAHLDLLGQYLLNYAFDGPDAERPEILGTGDLQGDRHQTAAETFASVKGGVCVGDCDDLAEVYVELLRRQGRHALALGVPGHMFAASAEQTADGWAVHVLQTGLAETHRAAGLVDAVVAALRSQDLTLDPDPVRIEAWPRVDDGPTRTLTWIDAGALRDATSVEHVVHHARLESRGLWATTAADRRADVERFERTVADREDAATGFEHVALHARLAEALSATGRFADAFTAASRAADLARRPIVRVGQRVLAVEAALAAGDRATSASAVVALGADLDALDDGSLPVSTVNTLIEVVSRLLDAADGGASGARLAARRFPDLMRALRERVEGKRSDVAVDDDVSDVADVLDSVVTVAARAARVSDDASSRAALLDAIRPWVEFARQREELGIWADHAAVLATLERDDPDAFVAWLGRQRPMSGAPEFADPDADLASWFASECITWEWELLDRLRPGQPRPDDRTLRTLTRGLARGALIRQAEDSFDEEDAHTQIWGKLIESALLGNGAAAPAALRVAEMWIPERLPDLAYDIAGLAAQADLETWLATVGAWLDTDGRARDAFLVVWATRAAGAGDHARAAADLVCTRFPDDVDFARERDALRALKR